MCSYQFFIIFSRKIKTINLNKLFIPMSDKFLCLKKCLVCEEEQYQCPNEPSVVTHGNFKTYFSKKRLCIGINHFKLNFNNPNLSLIHQSDVSNNSRPKEIL
ncbi:hypothetical protein EDEG_02367 [Edhazardia aedis USNM 41457]|uniref:Uncharacterized protein n=1 Tax=Edhazardia aedis (strain USNM 41457) TaxID=1003232 RepID=J9DL02_EDHAE|nr:hypothetical protein EDEG_02367 [Edhazardia aedis USNM 41457]|eukprot:EJW03275.1 hypothetical protein EDEG_02367 [Edhazardia aedis USNM 41457]